VVGERGGGARRCLVLGAGFSRAVSVRMPTTDELGELATEELSDAGVRLPPQGFKNGYFEAWLSRLAEPQPDLRDDENLHNQAWFVRLTQILRDVLASRQEEVMAGSPPWWLRQLIGVAHRQRMTVISFNYDTLFEAAFDASMVTDWARRTRPSAYHLIGDLPPVPVRAGTYGASPADTFRLIKLHGSVDCWWVNGDVTGATINRYPAGAWRHGQPWPDEQTPDQTPPGRTPFVVPPAAAKSSFYRNPVTRELWRRAAVALGEADRVALIGYSLPVTDLVTSGMLADRLQGRDVAVDVVNLDPAPPVAALSRLGINALAPEGSVESYVDALEREARQAAIVELADQPERLPILVGTTEGNVAAVTGSTPTEQGMRLEVEAVSGSTAATRRREPGEVTPMTVSDVRRTLREDGGLYVQFPDGHEAGVIGWARLAMQVGSTDEWAVAILSAAPSETR